MFGEVLLNDQRYNENSLLKPYRSGGERSDNPYVNFIGISMLKGNHVIQK